MHSESAATGTIYRARDHVTGGTVAVKVVSAEDVGERERFQREAALLAELDHPAIVRYIAGMTNQQRIAS